MGGLDQWKREDEETRRVTRMTSEAVFVHLAATLSESEKDLKHLLQVFI